MREPLVTLAQTIIDGAVSNIHQRHPPLSHTDLPPSSPHMRILVLHSTALIAALTIAGSAAGSKPRLLATRRLRELGRVDACPNAHTDAYNLCDYSADLKTRLYIFADDSMQGRLLATAGNVKGTDYIASEVKRMGLLPMGDNGTYFRRSTSSIASSIRPANLSSDPPSSGCGQILRRAIRAPAPAISMEFRQSSAGPGRLGFADRSRGGGREAGSAESQSERSHREFRWRCQSRHRHPYFAGATGVAVASLEAMPPQLMRIFQQPNQVLKGERDPDLPSFLYISRPVARALLGADLDSAKTGALGRRYRPRPDSVNSQPTFPHETLSPSFAAATRSCATSTSRSVRTTITSAGPHDRSRTIPFTW